MQFGSFLSFGLLKELEILAAENQCVLWIRNQEYDEQVYLSSNYWTLWERDPILLYQKPESWSESLNTVDAEAFSKELIQKRTLINESYTEIYCVKLKNDLQKWFQDRSLHFPIANNKKIIIGCALAVEKKEMLDSQQEEISDKIDLIITKFYRILSFTFPTLPENTPLKDGFLLKKLSKREIQTLKLFLQGYTITQAANAIHLSPRTIENHLTNLKNKLNCDSKSELIMKAMESNWISINL